MSFCAIDFGTSNSAVALPENDRIQLVPLERGQPTLPSAVFFNADENSRAFGREAIAQYIEGYDGRLMRSLKSILGSSLALATTEIGGGAAMPFLDVIALFLHHLVRKAEAVAGTGIDTAVIGRPVFFVDDDPKADQAAQAQLASAAHTVGLRNVHFQYEPIAAAFDYESHLREERLVMVADIGGGTSDFSLVRVGPQRARRLDRKDDVLAHHGVHSAGTDFDKRVSLASVMRELGYGSLDGQGREVPNRIYFDLAIWHLINTVYSPRRVSEFALLNHLYQDGRYHARLMRVLERRLGHALAGAVESAKIAVAAGGTTDIELAELEDELRSPFSEAQLVAACSEETRQIVNAARQTASLAGIAPEGVDALYFTGGSTGLRFLSNAIAAAFPAAETVHGDRLASVAMGLGIHARRLFS